MGKSSIRKGKAGEREWAEFLREHLGGAKARRSQQGAGGHIDPDVRGLEGWWCEVKRQERLALPEWLRKLDEDVERSGTDDRSLLAFRRNREPWRVVLRAEDFARLIRRIEELEQEQEG